MLKNNENQKCISKKIIKLEKNKIDEIFENVEKMETPEQYYYWRELFIRAFKNWDKIKKISGFPKVNKKTWFYICNKCIEFDNKYHKNEVLAGGLWVDKGFSQDNTLEDWSIDISHVGIELNE
ncbi:MAG: hypothetical protein EAX96_06440 [Candidatus Lokiarchaeota archaeon]|nr:hypothetical protein [Candidatus Lokiarchaeota archaeon]